MGETFGVMVYQEDVMKIVHHFAGLGLDESDMLRRLMSGKKRQGDQFEVLRKNTSTTAARWATRKRWRRKSGGRWRASPGTRFAKRTPPAMQWRVSRVCF